VITDNWPAPPARRIEKPGQPAQNTDMDFEKRLQKAIERGQQVGDAKGRADAERALSEDDLRNLHSQYRLQLSEHIESCLRQLADHLPGFRFSSIMTPEGWGASISRDDLESNRGNRIASYFSRLEMVIRPFSPVHIVELSAKGTIRNKEIFHRNHFQQLTLVDLHAFTELIDMWTLEYAEQYASRR
jgi:hypothetical protein